MKKVLSATGVLLGALHFASQLRDIRRYAISRTDVVLDVGSGQNPHPRANILVDKFLTTSHERAGGGGLVIDRPLILTDAANTPFPAKAFDFVFCSHLLEHVESPSSLMDELMRIGKRGYLETPSKTYEKLWGWSFHRWYVSTADNQLIVEKKLSEIFDTDLHAWFGARMGERPFSRLILLRLRAFGLLVRFYWTGSIDYEVRDAGSIGVDGSDPGDEIGQDTHNGLEQELAAIRNYPYGARARLKQAIARRVRRGSDPITNQLLLSLECPSCRSRLTAGETRYACQGCRVEFARSADLFDFTRRLPG
ncbi:MAG TPA: methyltransferase domain-containing protein [Actinomycetota bacterium]|nr:methyltransferase domain-containing protein [Actinomycetota bacterium]